MKAHDNKPEFRRIFDYHLMKMEQAGIINKIIADYIPEPPLIIGMSEANQLGYDNLVFPMIVLSVGLTSALVILTTEKLGQFLRAKWAKFSNPEQVKTDTAWGNH